MSGVENQAGLDMLRRLDAGEPLRLIVGSGIAASELILSPAYVEKMRAEIQNDLRLSLESSCEGGADG